jgi:hypothetical protein
MQPHYQLVEKIRERGGTALGVGDRVPSVIVQGKRGKKNKELFVDRAEDHAYVFEHASGHGVLRGKADLAARAAYLRELWGNQRPALLEKGAEPAPSASPRHPRSRSRSRCLISSHQGIYWVNITSRVQQTHPLIDSPAVELTIRPPSACLFFLELSRAAFAHSRQS